MPAGATYEPIATTTLGSNQATVTLSSIPSTYTDLIVVCFTAVNQSTSGWNIDCYVNGDTAANYSTTRLIGNGSAASSSRTTGDNYARVGLQVGGNSGLANYRGMTKIHFFNYAGSTNKTFMSENAEDSNGSGEVRRTVNLWRSTSAINSISFTDPGGTLFLTGSTFTLYGIARA
jgi:hypothetical protein